MTEPLVSVVLCTRNRPEHLRRAVVRILQSDYPNFELLIVDQSENPASAQAIKPLVDDRIRFVSFAGIGKSAALNYARRHLRGDYVVLTDDDCEMSRDCISNLIAALHADPGLGIVFGNVIASSHRKAGEYIPYCHVLEPKTIRDSADYLTIPVGRSAPWINHGMGANMAIRAAVLRELQGWDYCVGPGAKFGSGDDHDLAFRTLEAGYSVHFCPQASVVHHGVHSLDRLRQYHRRIGRGFGASYIKFLKCGIHYPGSARTFRFHLFRYAFRLVTFGSIFESAAFIRGWLSGFIGGLRHPVNSETHLFKKHSREQSEAPDQLAGVCAGSSEENVLKR